MWTSYRGPAQRRRSLRLQGAVGRGGRSAQSHLLRQRMMSELPPLERTLLRLPRAHQLDRFILQAGLHWRCRSCCSAALALCAASYLAADGAAAPAAAGRLLGAAAFAAAAGLRRGASARRLSQDSSSSCPTPST
jgi:tight adherence protein B